jgi:chaperonin cofactor prefoldin
LYEERNYAIAQAQAAQLGTYRPPSLTQMMTERKARLESELEEVNKVLSGLAKNPEAAELFDSISRLGGLR